MTVTDLVGQFQFSHTGRMTWVDTAVKLRLRVESRPYLVVVPQVVGQAHVANVAVVERVAAADPADAAAAAVVLLLVIVVVQTTHGAEILPNTQQTQHWRQRRGATSELWYNAWV